MCETVVYSTILTHFVRKYPCFAHITCIQSCIFIDDGYSGGNFDRPAWKRLLADIEAGKVGAVLAKEMSRIGRDYLQTGYYTEIVFRQNNVRFIAIGNGIDSNDPTSSEFAPFMNIMNEWYLRDLSRKQKAAIRTKGESGKPTTTRAIYGYKKDPSDKNKWLIDEEAAAVVRRIFRLTIEGHGPYEIARMLFEDQVDSPAVYFAQKVRKTPKRIDTLGEANPLTGLLYCADCGEKMYNHRRRRNVEKDVYPSDFFNCSSYLLAHQKYTTACCNHYITTKAIQTLVLEAIRAASAFAIADQDAFMQKIREASQVQQEEAVRDIKRKLNKDRKRHQELDGIIKKLYESYATGRLSEERFDALLAEYEDEQKNLAAAIAMAEENLSSYAEDTVRAEQFLALAKTYTDFTELTIPMINEFIDRIIVHAPEKIDGDRVQEVEIYLNFIGKFELPPAEPTPEEIKRQDSLRRHRIKSRERYRQIKAGERAVGVPVKLTCKCCGQEFESIKTNAMFCGPNCRGRYYRQEAAANRNREHTCQHCGKSFISDRKNVKYCSDECRHENHCIQCRERYAAQKKLAEGGNGH